MPEETDKILEAEESIQNIADELTRLRNAANLLENAQNQKESILDTAETVINEVKNLTSTFKEVVSNLSSLNINQRLSELEKQVREQRDYAQKHAEETSSMIVKSDTELGQLKKFAQTTAKNHSNAFERLNAGQEDIESEVRKTHTATQEHAEFSNFTAASASDQLAKVSDLLTQTAAATNEELAKIGNLLVQLTEKRGLFLFSRTRKRKA